MSTQPTPPTPMSRNERIRELAYRRFQDRGGTTGDELRDWLDAEAELDRLDAGNPAPGSSIASKSGADLGRPDLEYGAYGMVKPASGDQAPSQAERKVRGVGSKQAAQDPSDEGVLPK